MRTPRLSRQSIGPRLLLSLTLALSLLFATASSVFADGHEGTLPASGGTVEFESGVTIKTPDGASTSDVTVTFATVEGDAIPGEAPEGSTLGSLVFSLDAGGATFRTNAEITIPYTAADVEAAGGRSDNVSVYSWIAISGSWVERYSIPNVIDNTLAIFGDSLDGVYAIVNTPPSEEPEATPEPMMTATVAPPAPEATPPETGGFGASNSLMMGLALLGMLFLVGGGYVLVRGRTR